MSDNFEVGGFCVSIEGDEAVCRFVAGEDFGEELPPAMEDEIAAEFKTGGRLAGRRLVVVLDEVAAVSSRQLGALLSLHRGAGGEQRVPIRGVRPNVRGLFEMSRMDKFFDY